MGARILRAYARRLGRPRRVTGCQRPDLAALGRPRRACARHRLRRGHPARTCSAGGPARGPAGRAAGGVAAALRRSRDPRGRSGLRAHAGVRAREPARRGPPARGARRAPAGGRILPRAALAALAVPGRRARNLAAARGRPGSAPRRAAPRRALARGTPVRNTRVPRRGERHPGPRALPDGGGLRAGHAVARRRVHAGARVAARARLPVRRGERRARPRCRRGDPRRGRVPAGLDPEPARRAGGDAARRGIAGGAPVPRARERAAPRDAARAHARGLSCGARPRRRRSPRHLAPHRARWRRAHGGPGGDRARGPATRRRGRAAASSGGGDGRPGAPGRWRRVAVRGRGTAPARRERSRAS